LADYNREKEIMKIEVDLKKLTEYKITIDEYLLMECLYLKNKEVFWQYLEAIEIPLQFKDCITNGYLLQDGDVTTFDNISVTEKYINIFHNEEEESLSIGDRVDLATLFKEFLSIYPVKVPDGVGGDRYLHLDKAGALQLYKKIIGSNSNLNIDLHNLIIKCLQFEINKRKKGMSMTYFQKITKYLKERNWEPYVSEVERMEENIVEKDKVEGI
jgi:hypothetical protein